MDKPYFWEKIDISTHLTNEMTSFHVNMKEFMGMYADTPFQRNEGENVEKNRMYNFKVNKLYDLMNSDEGIDEKYLIDMDRIMPFVFTMREMRKLHEAISNSPNFGGIITNWLVDYLRFYKYNDKYIVTNDCEPLEWRKYMSETFVGGN